MFPAGGTIIRDQSRLACNNGEIMLNRIVPILVLFGLVVGLPHVQASDVVWLEAEQFNHLGGWKNDPQFIDQMGSPFLLAVGLGQPTDDAKTLISLAQSQQYRLWVRTRDWVAQHHPGRFQVILDDKVVEHPFGADGNSAWHWEDGGMHLLPSSLEVRLHDLTGYYARCDAIVFASDPQWRPPESADQLASFRAQHGGSKPTHHGHAEARRCGRWRWVGRMHGRCGGRTERCRCCLDSESACAWW